MRIPNILVTITTAVALTGIVPMAKRTKKHPLPRKYRSGRMTR